MIKILYGDETFEQLRIQGAMYGKIELYCIHAPTDDELSRDLQTVVVNDEILEEPIVKSTQDVPVEIVDLSGDVVDHQIDLGKLEDSDISENEDVIDDEDAGSTDDEFINVQLYKKNWVSKRNNSGKEQCMKDYIDKENTKIQRAKGQKDNYWGDDEDENLQQEGQYEERDSDDEGPRSLSDDDDDLEALKKCEWPLYDPTTLFGSVELELGQLFEKVEVLKKALIYYSCQTRHSFQYCRNESGKVLVKCKFYPDCRWKLSARYTKDHGCIQIRFFKDIHTCTPTMKNKRVTAEFLAEEYQEKLLKHPTWKLNLFIRDVEDTYGVKINRWQARRAKRNALSACGKVVGRQYDSLRAYMYELKRSNESSSVFLSLKSSIPSSIPQFHMIYINFAALRRNFIHGCRRVLGLDGAFLKGYCKGEILCAVARDANNQMFPVAWAVVEHESKESWSWFLGHLIDDLEMQKGEGWTLLSDQQKGLLIVIAEMLPNAEHRLCARHIFTNWIKVIKGILVCSANISSLSLSVSPHLSFTNY